MGSNDMPELGSKISLISKADIRYEGKLFTVDPQDCTIALANVRSFGTEDRVTDHQVPAQAQVYDYILFRATDIKDISVIPSPPVLYDPAIVQLSVPPSIGPNSGSRFQGGFQHPVLGQLGGSAMNESSTRPIGSASQANPGGYNPMQSGSLLNPLHNRPRQTSESQRLTSGSVAELLNSGGAPIGSRSSTPGLGRRISMSDQGTQANNQRQPTPPRYNADHNQQRHRNNSQSNSSNHEDRSYGSRQYSQSKPRDQQPHQQQQQQQQRFIRHLDNSGYNRDNRNDNSYANRGNDNLYGNNRSNQPQLMNQKNRYQGNNMQQNHRMNMRGSSGDRMQDQRMMGQRRNQGGMMMGGNRPQGGGQRQGGGQQRQGGGPQNRGRPRGQFNNYGQPKQLQPKQPLKFDSDYDFDKANTEFEELRHSLAQVKIADGAAPVPPVNQPAAGSDDKKDDSGNETAVGECDQEDEGVSQVTSAYDKTKSFFDNISCEAIERSKGRSQRTDWRKELKLNSETFGVSVSRRFYMARGRGYYRGSWKYKPSQQNNIIVAKV